MTTVVDGLLDIAIDYFLKSVEVLALLLFQHLCMNAKKYLKIIRMLRIQNGCALESCQFLITGCVDDVLLFWVRICQAPVADENSSFALTTSNRVVR